LFIEALRGSSVTIDEELTKLEENIRRLRIEYEAYFNGGSPRAPSDTLFRVEHTIKKYGSNSSKMSFVQRFRFTQLSQKYAVHSELWRKRLRDKEEGRESFPRRRRGARESSSSGTRIVCSNPDSENEKVDQLLDALVTAKRSTGEQVENIDPAAFRRFVQQKTEQVKQSLGCEQVQFTVVVEDGKVKFKAGKAE
jgi:hypothetical protein